MHFIILSCVLNYLVLSVSSSEKRSFPENFIWGVSTSAYQIEGGWNEGGRGESIWDEFVHKSDSIITDKSTGDIAADSYHKWRDDIKLVKDLNVKIYRFSISWTRIIPSGILGIGKVNKAGIKYYNDLINELLKFNITPMITLYHWDLPQKLQLIGGWTNPEIVEHFTNYADVAFNQFSDRVKLWTTINEPVHVCEEGYSLHFMAPGYNFSGLPSYLCGHNILKAHASAVHLFRNKYSKNPGKIGITLDSFWHEPKTNRTEDKNASERVLQFYLGWFAHPIFSPTGNYPSVMVERIDKLSAEQGFSKSRLPKFTQAEVDFIRGTADFFAFNTYGAFLVSPNDNKNSARHPVPSFLHDAGAVLEFDPAWKETVSEWFRIYPSGINKLIKWISKEYANPEIIITENGVSDKGALMDVDRVEYFRGELNAVLDAIQEGYNVWGYIAWSLLDSFEWTVGYTETFGLYKVNFTDPNRTRQPKLSAKVYSEIVRTNSINFDYSQIQAQFENVVLSGGSSPKSQYLTSSLTIVIQVWLIYKIVIGYRELL